MQKIEARSGQLVRWNAKHGVRYVQTASFAVAKELERRIGQVYGIIVVDANPKVGEALFAHIEDSFSRGALEAARRCSPDATHEMLFESVVGQVNHAVTRALGERGLGIEPEYVSAALIAVHGHDVVAAIWGRPSVLLYHPTAQGLRAFDLADDGSTPSVPGRRCFGSVISGRIGERDRLLLATQDVRDILGDDVAARAMAAAEPAMATKLLRDALAPIEEELTIALLALDVAPVRYLEDLQAGRSVTTQSSLAELRRVESRTEEIMSPSPLSAIQKTLAYTASAVRGTHVPTPTSTGVSVAAPVTAARRKEISVSRALVAGIKVVFLTAWRLIRSLMAINWRTAPRDAAARLDAFAESLVDRYNTLPALRQRILLGILLSVLALNTSVLAGTWQTSLADFSSAAERRVAGIEQKIDSAEASLIYRDEARARTLLDEAAVEVATLPERSAKNRETKSDMTARIAAARDGMRRAVALGSPEVIATVAVSGAEAPALSRLATAGGALWGVSSKGELFRISPTDGAAQKAGSLAAEPKIVLPVATGVLAAASSGAATIVPASGTGGAKDARIDAAGMDIADADTWNGRLYVLDPTHNRILRLAADDQGYGAAQFYLKDGTDVSKGVSLAIDGAVWVLDRDGGITHLLKGSREPFAAVTVDPPITAARRLRTTATSTSLYVLDTAPSRIVRFDKETGALVAQYESPSLAGATDFTVDEGTKTLLATVGNQVLKFGLPE